MGCISSKPQVSSPRHYYAESVHSGRASSEMDVSSHRIHTGLSGPQSSSLSYNEQCLIGVARWPDNQYNQEHTASQMAYGQSFWQASRHIGQEIANGDVSTFDALWDKARDWRVAASGGDYETFGEERYPSYYRTATTPLANQYEYIKDRFSHRTDGELCYNDTETPNQEFPLRENLDGNTLALSAVVMSTDPHANRHDEHYATLSHMESGEPFYIRHTYSADVEAIMEHVNGLYNKALDPHLSDSKFIKNLANIHWWAANAMPDKRGSAAKAELCVRSIAQARGMDLPPLRHGVVADLEAMTTPREKFVKNYMSMFER
ncbi:XopAH/AvrB family type III secretion system effector [Erwinia psidii]|uniref:Type III effector n=1 Tax=Erwinia psidii TaxID=69224 RepID=A0A3N6S7L1_9GAMM|nr:XopAH/AvrB family type III secretion system effector [Erwinia psidii]RQM37110.1 type III effector [Erwinia psidii]